MKQAVRSGPVRYVVVKRDRYGPAVAMVEADGVDLSCWQVQQDITYFDVMSDDLGRNAKTLWSIDDTTTDGSTDGSVAGDGSIDLLTKDIAGVCNESELGASMWITADGRIGYDTSIFAYLAAGQTAIDHFTYPIRLSNGTLSWATVT